MSLSMTERRLTVVGSGSLARSICHSLAASATSIRVSVVARNGAAVDDIVRGCRARAAVSAAPATFIGVAGEDVAAAVGRLRPEVVVCVASTQSPYERVRAPSPWTRLVERAGFGITLPFQAAGKNVKENSFSGGVGTQFGNGRVITDFAVVRALRSADIGATERAWTMSFGISVRP